MHGPNGHPITRGTPVEINSSQLQIHSTKDQPMTFLLDGDCSSFSQRGRCLWGWGWNSLAFVALVIVPKFIT